ncbi:MAG: UTP--glucose-1-phosphate uridylyltransferase, partial [Anaerolineae bacterium]|nr:UTP--glucose-1-phosphate uridylyltransferase [Anaerolineae bacterium]
AQCPSDDMDSFQDVSRHKYFNTNNLWLNLPALKAMLQAKDNILGLPMIRNSKTVDPRDSGSTPVYQLETAMGSAIGIFQGAGAIRVPRTRFAPVKTTEDLLAIRSDAYILTDDYRIVGNPERTLEQIVISLDKAYYKLIDDMEARFPHGAPSLIDCERLAITGDVTFGPDVVLSGAVQIINESDEQRQVEAGAVIEAEKVL